MAGPLIEFGGAEGLAQASPDYQQKTENLFRQETLNRQARQDAENRAKLFGDMFQFGEATDNYNKQKLNEFTTQQLGGIGKFVTDNGGYSAISMNPGLMGQFKSMTHKLLDNDYVKNSMAGTQEYTDMVKFMHDNPGSHEMPEFQDTLAKNGRAGMLEQWDNWRKTGDVYGRMNIPEQEKQRFTFQNPASNFDIQSVFEKYAKGLHQSAQMLATSANTKRGGVRVTTDQASLQNAAALMMTGSDGIKTNAIWKAMDPRLKAAYKTSQGGDDDAKLNWIYQSLKAMGPADKVIPEELWKPGVGKGAAGTVGSPIYSEILNQAASQPNMPVTVSPEVVKHAFGLDNGQFDFGNVSLLTGHGNIDGTGNEVRISGGLGLMSAVPTGKIIHVKDMANPNDPGRTVTEYNVMMPLPDFVNRLGKLQIGNGKTAWDAINFKGSSNLSPNVSNDSDWDVHGPNDWFAADYSRTFSRVEPHTPENPSSIPAVKMRVRQDMPAYNETVAGNWNHASDVTNTKATYEEDAGGQGADIPYETVTDGAGNYFIRTPDGQTFPVNK